MTAGGLHARLRLGTRELHRAAETALDAERRLATTDSYADLLDRLWSLHAGAECALEVHHLGAMGVDLGLPPRSSWLALDLEVIAGRQPLRSPVRLSYASREAALGGLYVLEGSALGGQVLFRHARRSLGISAERGGRFLSGDGSDTGRRWRAFLTVLAAMPQSGPEADRVEDGALATFRLFVDQLARE